MRPCPQRVLKESCLLSVALPGRVSCALPSSLTPSPVRSSNPAAGRAMAALSAPTPAKAPGRLPGGGGSRGACRAWPPQRCGGSLHTAHQARAAAKRAPQALQVICALRAAGRSSRSGTVVSVTPKQAAHGQYAAKGRRPLTCDFLAVQLSSTPCLGKLPIHGCRDHGTGVVKLRGFLRREIGRPSLQA